MNRRSLLKLLAAFPLFIDRLQGELARASSVKVATETFKRVRPGDKEWPAEEKWNTLREQVGGNLMKLDNPFEPKNKADLEPLLKNLENPYFISDSPALTQSAGWLDAWNSAPSIYAVAAQRASDVAAAVNFARDNKLRLVVKGGGHSYLGTSNAPDSLLVWTHSMREIVLHDNFVPQGASEGTKGLAAVSVGAGCIWMDVYHKVTVESGRYVQGGGCATVGVAGLLQSGGFGSFSKHYGMAAASLLEAEIVTADGAIRIVNQYKDADLYWAIKGGGGGSFGVVTRLTLKTHDLPEFFGGVHIKVKAKSDEAYKKLIANFVAFYKNSLFNPHWGEQAKLGPNNVLEISMVSHGLSKKESEQVWQPFLDSVRSSPELELSPNLFIEVLEPRYWWDAEWRRKNYPKTIVADSRSGASPNHVFWEGDQGQVSVFWHGYESTWLPEHLLFGNEQEMLVDALYSSSRTWCLELHFNKGLAGAPEEAVRAARDTATNPAVLDAFALAIIAGGERAFPSIPSHKPKLKSAREDAANIAKAMHELRKVVPRAGSYVSESNYFERSWQDAYWGSNYQQLLSVKNRYDPDCLFFVHNGAGSEQWDKEGFVRQTVHKSMRSTKQ
jgi:FAD/FMN-containing dehydrogenase